MVLLGQDPIIRFLKIYIQKLIWEDIISCSHGCVYIPTLVLRVTHAVAMLYLNAL